jgi:4-hydroxy-tetrahydrodipicolinate synthase
MGPGFDLLKVVTNPIAIKTALNLLGHDLGGFRLPMVDATDDETERVRACLERAGVLSAASA